MYSSKWWHYVQPERWQKRVKSIHQFLYSPQMYFLPLPLQAFDLLKRTLAGGPRGPKCSCLVNGIFCGFLCSKCFAIFFVWSKNAKCTMIGLNAASRLWHLWRASTILWDPGTEMMKIIWRIIIKKWGKSYYLMIITVIMIPSLSLLSLTPVEDSLIILTPPMSMCQYFAKNDALQQKQCIATFCCKSL